MYVFQDLRGRSCRVPTVDASVISYIARNKRHAVLAAIVALGAVLRCVNLGQSLWWDEIWSTLEYATASSWWYTVSRLGYYFNNHPLYSVACRISIAAFGLSEVSVRLPSVIMGIAALPVLYMLARPLTGREPALLAAFLLALSAFHIDHSTEARGYAGMMLFALLSSHFFLQAIRTRSAHSWVYFTLCTFLGMYCHPYMAQVPFAQAVCCMLLVLDQSFRKGRVTHVHKGAAARFLLALGAAVALTLTAYAPMLRFFVANAAKVRFFHVDRLPFVLEMYEAVQPGFTSAPGMALYSVLMLCGLLYLRKRSPALLVYTVLVCNAPLLIYLQLDPMFIFKRYFLPALPFSLLTLACGVVWIAGACRMRGAVRFVFYCALLGAVMVLQWPALRTVTTESRQHYREAVAFVENHAQGRDCVVFAIGHAGNHFSFYTHRPVIVPETFGEFKAALDSGVEVWCLVSGWLPDLRPAHEPAFLYNEKPQHQRIYDYVRKHFNRAAYFRAAFPTSVYVFVPSLSEGHQSGQERAPEN